MIRMELIRRTAELIACLCLTTPVLASAYPMSPIQFPLAWDFNAEIRSGNDAGAFVSLPQRTKTNLDAIVAENRSLDPAGAADLEVTLAAVDIVGETGKAMRASRLDPHNMADVYAVWWINIWSHANMEAPPKDAAIFLAVAAQARAYFATLLHVAGLSDAEKQRYAEAMIVQSVLTSAAFNIAVRGIRATGSIRISDRIAMSAKANATKLGVDVDAIELTSGGFRVR